MNYVDTNPPLSGVSSFDSLKYLDRIFAMYGDLGIIPRCCSMASKSVRSIVIVTMIFLCLSRITSSLIYR